MTQWARLFNSVIYFFVVRSVVYGSDRLTDIDWQGRSMQIHEEFNAQEVPEGFYWFNEPASWHTGTGLEVCTGAKSDFWQETHYGFKRDDGHCLFTRLTGDFAVMTQVEFAMQEQYDQCGLMVRVDERNWIKVSTEREDERTSRLGSVVTNLGWSDWATQDVCPAPGQMWYRISRNRNDFLLEHSLDGTTWLQMRITHLHSAQDQLEVGPYACSPIGRDFRCRFLFFDVDRSNWS